MHSTIRDDDAVLRIDAATRQVIVPPGSRIIGVAGDHGSEQLTIACPRYVEGHDLAGCAMKWITWQDAQGKEGDYEIANVEVGSESIHLLWTITAGLTAHAGRVAFNINFMDLDSQGRVVYKWSTGKNKDLRVLDGDPRVEEGVALAFDEESGSGLLQVEVDEARLNAAVVAAARSVLYG